MPVAPNALLDLAPGVGQRAETFQFELVNRNLEYLGQVHPDRTQPLTMNLDTTGTVPRSVQGVQLREHEWRDLDLDSHLRVVHVLEDGTRNDWGVFAFDDDAERPHSQDTPLSVTLFDGMADLNDGVHHSVSLGTGASIRAALIALIEEAGITRYRVADFDATVGDPVYFQPGTARLQVMRALCSKAGQLPPYIDNAGWLVVRANPNLLGSSPVEPDHRYTLANSRVLPDTTERRRRRGRVPNAYMVIGSGGQGAEVYATAYVDPSLPHSREKRGKTVTDVWTAQGLATWEACLQLAMTRAQADPRQHETMEFASVVDSRHDTFQVIEYQFESAQPADLWLEVAWSAVLAPLGTHTHRCVKRLELTDA